MSNILGITKKILASYNEDQPLEDEKINLIEKLFYLNFKELKRMNHEYLRFYEAMF